MEEEKNPMQLVGLKYFLNHLSGKKMWWHIFSEELPNVEASAMSRAE